MKAQRNEASQEGKKKKHGTSKYHMCIIRWHDFIHDAVTCSLDRDRELRVEHDPSVRPSGHLEVSFDTITYYPALSGISFKYSSSSLNSSTLTEFLRMPHWQYLVEDVKKRHHETD